MSTVLLPAFVINGLCIPSCPTAILWIEHYMFTKHFCRRSKTETPSLPSAVAHSTTLAPALYILRAASGDVTPPTPMILICAVKGFAASNFENECTFLMLNVLSACSSEPSSNNLPESKGVDCFAC